MCWRCGCRSWIGPAAFPAAPPPFGGAPHAWRHGLGSSYDGVLAKAPPGNSARLSSAGTTNQPT
eukprot:1575984-Prorocentrum_lima.AAC.1